MGNALLSSKIVIQEEEPSVRQIAGVPSAVPGFLGITERGPFGQTLISAGDYRKIFGGYVASGELIQALDGYFSNGGTAAWVSRIAHYSDPTTPATLAALVANTNASTASGAATSAVDAAANNGPYVLAAAQTLVVSIDGGGNQTFTFLATAATRTDGATYPVVLSDGLTLTLSIDGGSVQTITFHTGNFVSIGAATAAEVAAVIAASLIGANVSVVGGHVKITSASKGTGSGVNVTGGSANAGKLAYTTGNTAGTGSAVNIAATTAAEVAALLTATITGATATVVSGKPTITSSTTGTGSHVLVTSGSTATAIGFDNATHTGLSGIAVATLEIAGKTPGAYANALATIIEAATSQANLSFNLRVTRGGVTLETWPNLTMDSANARYAPTIINNAQTGSDYIAVTDLAAAIPLSVNRPANGTYVMTGGDDGLTSLNDNDWIGGVGTAGERTGMRAFDKVPDLTLLAAPGHATATLHLAMVAYCEVTRGGAVQTILDPPSNLSALDMVTYATVTAGLEELSEFGALYWPRIKVANPSKSVFGSSDSVVISPSGYIIGVIARNDGAREGGIYSAPAGIDNGKLLNVLGFETDEVLDEDVRDIIYPHRINPLNTIGAVRCIDGVYTLKSTGNFSTIAERRGASFLEQSIKTGLQFARHKNNDAALRSEVTRTVTTFLSGEMAKGAFRSKDPNAAFFVDFGPGLNTDAVVSSFKLIGRIGIATQKPAEFIVLSFSQMTLTAQQAA